ncbi:UNVERIFIED_ORG: PAP2 superfamily protein [Martelella mediterranea]
MPSFRVKPRLTDASRHLGDLPPLKLAFVALFALWWVLLLFFYLFPDIDISVSWSFYTRLPCAPGAPDGIICGSFLHAQDKALGLLRELILFLPAVLALVIIYQLINVCSHHGATFDGWQARRLTAALAALLIGPGILVNWILKEISHRPRPRNTDLFGGQHAFMPAGDFSGSCVSNCSFVSGEAAAAGWLFCYAVFIIPNRLKLLLSPPLIAVSVSAPVMRVAYGGHYVSDVILAWLGAVVIFIGILYLFEEKETTGMKHH